MESIFNLSPEELMEAERLYIDELRFKSPYNTMRGLEKARALALEKRRFFSNETRENYDWLLEHEFIREGDFNPPEYKNNL